MSSVLVIGGARSGKSSFAESLFEKDQNVTYVATAPKYLDDPEWQDRVALHRDRRPKHWKVLEISNITSVISEANSNDRLLIDCLTLWLTSELDELNAWKIKTSQDRSALNERLLGRFSSLVAACQSSESYIVFVTNEVGQGIVPDQPGARLFQDYMGILNMQIAKVCEQVYQVVAGIPVRIKE